MSATQPAATRPARPRDGLAPSPPWPCPGSSRCGSLGLVATSLLVALVGRRPFARAPRLTAALLLPLAGALYLAVGAGQMDLVVAACSFAGLVASQRLLSATSAATDGQVLPGRPADDRRRRGALR